MKVIDILNKIANGESVKFRVPEINYDEKTKRDDIFTLENGHLRNETCGKWIEFQIGIDDWEELSIGFLNKEVEIIEENKKIEQLKLNNSDVWNGKTDTDLVVDKINEIIDKINEMEYATRYLLGEKVEEVVKETEKLLKGEK